MDQWSVDRNSTEPETYWRPNLELATMVDVSVSMDAARVSIKTVRKYRITLEDRELRFREEYPEYLRDALPAAEFDGVVRKLNAELEARVFRSAERMRRWCILCISLSLVAMGVLGIPACLVAISKFRRRMRHFWEQTRVFLLELNSKVYQRRRIEWRIVENKRNRRQRDATLPILSYAIEITVKPIPPGLHVPPPPPQIPSPIEESVITTEPMEISTRRRHGVTLRRLDQMETVALIENLGGFAPMGTTEQVADDLISDGSYTTMSSLPSTLALSSLSD